MIKNGLFICSIGFLIILFSLNPSSMKYDVLSMLTGIFLVALGAYIFHKGNQKEKLKKKDEVAK